MPPKLFRYSDLARIARKVSPSTAPDSALQELYDIQTVLVALFADHLEAMSILVMAGGIVPTAVALRIVGAFFNWVVDLRGPVRDAVLSFIEEFLSGENT